MSHKCLHILRRIRDVAGVGIVLVGTEKLGALISPTHGEFDQIRSRVTIWPPTVTEIKREDADALAQAALDEQGELSGEVLDALWSYSKGSARMLTENLIPSIKDFGLAKGNELNAALVAAIAKQTLNLKAA
jgi:DNA transposition AAA+ family ATPase